MKCLKSLRLKSMESNNKLNFLRYFINFIHRIGFCPFRIQYDKQNNVLKLHSNIIFKIFAIITISLSCLNKIGILFKDMEKSKVFAGDLSKEFLMFSSLSNILYYSAIVNIFWFKSGKLLEIIQMFQPPNTLFTKENTKVYALTFKDIC